MGGPWEDYAPIKAEKGPWEDYAATAEPIAADEPTTPEWAAKSPNLYGVYGAAKETALTAGRFAKNLPGDTAQIVGDVGTLLTTKTPVDVGMDIGKVATGAVGKLIPGEQPYEQDFNALVDVYKNKYGSLENLKKTIETKPAEFLMDLTAAAGGGGAALKQTGKLTGVKALETAGKATTEAGVQMGTAPYKATIKAGEGVERKATKLIPKETTPIVGALSPERMYASATKMPLSKKWVKTLPGEEVSRRRIAIKTGLEEGTVPTERGWHEVQKKIHEVNENISGVIKTKKGDVVSTQEVFKPLDKLKDDYDLIPGGTYADEIDLLKTNTLAKYGESIPVEVAQRLKQQLYRVNSKHYGELKGITVESQKNLARGLKEELAKQYPELASLNARESSLLKLNEGLEKAIGRIANRDIVDLGTTVAAAGGGGFWGAMKFIVDNPYVKARLAIALYKARGIGSGAVKTTGSAIPSAIGGGAVGKASVPMPTAPPASPTGGGGPMKPLSSGSRENIGGMFSPKTRAILNSKISDAEKERFLTQKYEQATKTARSIDQKAVEAAIESGEKPQTWLQFLKGKMGPAMKEHGGHDTAIKEISKQYKIYKQSFGPAPGKVWKSRCRAER